MPKVTVIIPTMPGREKMLEKLKSTIPSNCEVKVSKDPDVLLAGKRNSGAWKAKGDYLLFIDDDNYLKKGAVEELVNSMDATIGVMGMVACYHNKKSRVADGGSIRNYLNGFTKGINTNRRVRSLGKSVYHVDEVANAFMIKKDLFDHIGGLDEDNFPIDLDEADLCKRLKDMGYKICMNPKAVCYHKSQTYSHIPDFRRPMNAYFMMRNKVLFQKKHLSPIRYAVYLCLFMPLHVSGYVLCLLLRKKPQMVYWILKGTLDGIRGNKSIQTPNLV